jgi:diguanylate cyclase (GGDEF)-like protein/PAS domain S-box-containing protein
VLATALLIVAACAVACAATALRRALAAERRARRALAAANLAEWDYDVESDGLYLGAAWAGFLGSEPGATRTSGAEILERAHPEDRAAVRRSFVAALTGESHAHAVDVRIRTVAGGWRWMHFAGRVSERNAAGRARRMCGTVADIDDRRRAESALREAQARLRDAAEASGEYAWEVDAAWRYRFVSERVEAVLGYRPAELLGRAPQALMPPGEARVVEAWLESHAPEGRAFRDLVHRVLTQAGRVVWLSVSAVPVRDAAGRFAGYRGTAADITPRKEAEARIEYLATRDPLTGLANRVLLADLGAQAIVQAARARSHLAALFIDLDRFKLVNESLGHAAGDALLGELAARLATLAGADTLARLSGDDFVLLHAVRVPEEAAGLAQRIASLLARAFTLEGRTLNVGASIGIALYPNDARDFPELVRSAEAAMYHAKEAGRGTFRFYSPLLHERSARRLALENGLHAALARGELVLHWQPVVRGRRRLVGAEALVRWRHPERGLLLPDEFVPLAEECGLIRAVGEWTLERAASQAGAWQRAAPGRSFFALNVSAAELVQGEAYIRRVAAALAANALPASCLELEVTERVLVSSLEENIATLARLGALGVRVAIDDFGTGYSSLAYLRQLPAHKLKIDRSFLGAIDRRAADEAIVRAIVTLARTLGISVAAEGVESGAQLARLLALGCEEWQGHHFSAPLEAAGFERLLFRREPRDEARSA